MGIVRGLNAINKHVEAEEAKYNRSDEDFVPTKWFKLVDKQSVKVVFLQELDQDSDGYSEKNGLGFLAVEHVNPKNWRRKAVCSMDDEGACYGCEQHRKDYKAGWKQKTRLYINVLVDEGGGKEPYVAVLSQGNGPKSITPVLIEEAGDGSITGTWYTIKRTGSGSTDTSYTLRGGKEKHGLDIESYELFDLEKTLRQIPYAEQAAHYHQGEEESSEETTAPQSETESSDSKEW